MAWENRISFLLVLIVITQVMFLKYVVWFLSFVGLPGNTHGNFVEKWYQLSPKFCTDISVSDQIGIIVDYAEDCRKYNLKCTDLLLSQEACLFQSGKCKTTSTLSLKIKTPWKVSFDSIYIT